MLLISLSGLGCGFALGAAVFGGYQVLYFAAIALAILNGFLISNITAALTDILKDAQTLRALMEPVKARIKDDNGR